MFQEPVQWWDLCDRSEEGEAKEKAGEHRDRGELSKSPVYKSTALSEYSEHPSANVK